MIYPKSVAIELIAHPGDVYWISQDGQFALYLGTRFGANIFLSH